jgi:hypothetical protein
MLLGPAAAFRFGIPLASSNSDARISVIRTTTHFLEGICPVRGYLESTGRWTNTNRTDFSAAQISATTEMG